MPVKTPAHAAKTVSAGAWANLVKIEGEGFGGLAILRPIQLLL